MPEQEPDNSAADASGDQKPIAIPTELVCSYVESQGIPRDHPDFDRYCRDAWIALSRRYGAVGTPSAIRALDEHEADWEQSEEASSKTLFEMAEVYLEAVRSNSSSSDHTFPQGSTSAAPNAGSPRGTADEGGVADLLEPTAKSTNRVPRDLGLEQHSKETHESPQSELGLSAEARRRIKTAIKAARNTLRQKQPGCIVEDPLRPHPGLNVLNTDRSTAESTAYALAVFNVWVTELWPIWTEQGAIKKRLDLTIAETQKDVVRQWHGLNEEHKLLFETVCLPAVKKAVDAEGDMWRLRALVLQSTPTPKASTEHQSERSLLLQIDGDSWFSDVPHSSERGAGSVFAVAYARDHPDPLLRPINAARLLAMGTLLDEAREAVQRVAPKTPPDAERSLRPAISKYAKEVFDRRAEVKLRDAGPRMRSAAYGHWLRSKCLPVVVDDVCMFDGLFQIAVRHVADYIGDGYPGETFRALWGILAREFEPHSFREGMETRLGAELEARSLFWLGQVGSDGNPRPRKAKGAAADATGSQSPSAEPPEPVASQRPGIEAPPEVLLLAMPRSRGPKRDYETAFRVAAVIAQVAPDGNWRARLEDICDEMDEADIRRPKTWKAKGYATWTDCCAGERDLVIKAIDHHLDRARERKETFS